MLEGELIFRHLHQVFALFLPSDMCCGSLIKKKLIIFGQIRYSDASNCKKDEFKTDIAMKMFFLIIYFLEVLFIFRRTKKPVRIFK